MGYDFTIKGAMHVKKGGVYPWPCDAMPDRTIELFEDDVLTVDPKTGKVMKHTGLGCLNICVPAEDLVPFERDVNQAKPEASQPFKVGDRVTWTVLKGCADGAWNDCVVTSVHPEWTDCCGHRGAVRILCKVRGVGLFPYYQTELA